MIELEALLAPIHGTDPCGPNLEYDLAFQALERAAQHRAEQRMGAAVRPAVPADWGQVEALAVALLRRTKDWRVARLLAQAWLQRDGIAGLARGLQLLAGMARAFGRDVHPQDEDDYGFGEDTGWPPLRLDGDGGLLQALRAWRFGGAAASVTAGDVERIRAGEAGHEAMRRAMQAAAGADPRLLPALAGCEAAIDEFRSAWGHWRDSPFDELGHLVTSLLQAARPPDAVAVETPPAAAPRRSPAPRRALAITAMDAPDLDALAVPCQGESPCGENLEYGQVALDLAQAMAGRPEQQFGSTLIEAVPPDWPRACALALTWLAASRDLRPAIAWTRAATRLHGLEGTAAGLRLVERLLNLYPTDLHPRPDPSEDGEPDWERRSALHALDATDGLLGDLRAWVWGAGGSALTGAQIELGDEADLAQRQGAVAMEGVRRPDTPAWLQEALAALRAIRHVVPIEPDGDRSDGGLLKRHLLRIRTLLQDRSTPVEVAATETAGAVRAEEEAAIAAMRLAYEALCARLDPALDGELCARAQRMGSRHFADIERGLAGRGAAGEGAAT